MQIGDKIEGITKALGIPSCGGCQKRKELLNGNGRWTKPWEAPAGWTLVSSFPADSPVVALFVHESGRRIIWEVEDGRYRRSYGYCCEPMKAAAEEKFQSLCRML